MFSELVVKEEVKDSDNEASEGQYDPSEPTAEEDSKPIAEPEVRKHLFIDQPINERFYM